eukprot:1098342-Rhodomonas_salina.1
MLAFKLGGIEPPAASTCRRSRTISSSYCGEGRVSTQHEHEKMREGKDKGSKILAGTGRDREGRVAAGGKTVFFKKMISSTSSRENAVCYSMEWTALEILSNLTRLSENKKRSTHAEKRTVARSTRRPAASLTFPLQIIALTLHNI